MNRFICITLCLSLFGCVESPEERTAFKKEVEALKLATEVLPGEIARLKAELQATQKPQESALSLSGVNTHTLKVRPNALRSLNLEYKADQYDTSFLDWAADQSLLQYPIYNSIRMDEGFELQFHEGCYETFVREHLGRAKAVYALNAPVLKFFKNLMPTRSAAKHRLLKPFIQTLVPQLIVHHQQILAFADWEARLSKLYTKAEAGELPSLQDFVDAGFPAGPSSECEPGIGWDETRAWFYGFWMRRHADGTFNHVARLLRILTNHEGLSVVARQHSRGCIAPFTHSSDGCSLQLDWDDDGSDETLSLAGPNLRVVHQDDTIPIRSYPWGYSNAARWNQRVTYRIIPKTISGVPLLAVTSIGLEAHTGETNTYYAYHPSRGLTLAAQENQGSDPPVWSIDTIAFAPDQSLVLKRDEGEERDEYFFKQAKQESDRLTQACTDQCDSPSGKAPGDKEDTCKAKCTELALEREKSLDGAGYQTITETKLCFKEGRYKDCESPTKQAIPTDCITCPEELPQCEDGCADCLITSGTCKACATATCLKVQAPTETPPEDAPPTAEGSVVKPNKP